MSEDFKDKYKDDPVYQEVQKSILPGHEIVDVTIEEPKVVGPKDPRKVMYVMVKTPKEVVEKYSINYLKVERRLRRKTNDLKSV